jgi:type VI protein secretion system component VasK
MTTKKSMVAGVGVVAACTACCTVPIAASAGLVAVAWPLSIMFGLITAGAGTWAWWRRRRATGESES